MSNELDQLRAFAQALLFDLGDVDGFELQELGLKHGLLETHTVEQPCGELCSCLEHEGSDGFPMDCIRASAALRGSA